MCQPGRPRPHGLSQPGSLGVGRLPQHEIGGIALVGRDLDPRAGDHLVAAAAREPAVIAGPRRPRTAHALPPRRHGPLAISRSIIAIICGDMLGGARLDIGRQAPERRHVLVELRRRALGQRRGSARLGLARRR